MFILAGGGRAQNPLRISLSSCREMALEQSESLGQAEHKYQQACLDDETARAAFFPKVEASATGTYVFPDMDMMGMDLRMRGTYMAGITLTQPLYAGGKIMSGKKMTQLGKSVAAEQKRMTRMDVLVEADNAYWTLMAVRQKVAMLESYKQQMDSLFVQVETAVRSGFNIENELLRIEANRSDVIYQLQKAENGEELCQMALCSMIGIDSRIQIELTDTVISVRKPELLCADISDRPELSLLKHQLDLTKEQIRMSRANMLPTVGLAAGYTYYGNIKLNSLVDAGNGTKIPYTQEFRDGLGAIMLSVKIPIFEWGANLKKVKKARFDFKNAELELNKNSRLMDLEAQRALRNIYEGYRLIQTAEVGLRLAEENLRVIRNKYNVSMLPLADLLDAQSQWKQAKSNLIEAQTQYKIYETEFLRATGKLD